MKRILWAWPLALIFLFAGPFHALASAPPLPEDPSQKVMDLAGVLTDPEEKALTEALTETAGRINMDVVVFTFNDPSVHDSVRYAEDFYEYGGYGVGAEYDGIMLYIDMNDRYVNTLTSGRATALYSTATQDAILDSVTAHLSGGDYYTACLKFAAGAERYASNLSQSEIDSRYGEIQRELDRIDGLEGLTPLGAAGVAAVIAVLFTGILLLMQARSMPKKPGLHTYFDEKGMRLTKQEDIFRHTHTTRTAIPQDTGGSGGGSGGVHRSSSGNRTFGGGSGRKF